MSPFLCVVDLINPKAEPFAVLAVDPTVRVGNGVRGIVQSFHWTRESAEAAITPGPVTGEAG